MMSSQSLSFSKRRLDGLGAASDSSPVVFMLRDARGTGARGARFLTTHHTSRSRAARVAQREDDWGRVRSRILSTDFLKQNHSSRNSRSGHTQHFRLKTSTRVSLTL